MNEEPTFEKVSIKSTLGSSAHKSHNLGNSGTGSGFIHVEDRKSKKYKKRKEYQKEHRDYHGKKYKPYK